MANVNIGKNGAEIVKKVKEAVAPTYKTTFGKLKQERRDHSIGAEKDIKNGNVMGAFEELLSIKDICLNYEELLINVLNNLHELEETDNEQFANVDELKKIADGRFSENKRE